MITLSDNPRLHVFDVDAMNTTFSLRIDHPDRELAKDAASACINRIEELEGILSRYRPDSDISRINRLDTGASILVAEPAHACLLKAIEAAMVTAGLFDPMVGLHTRGVGGESARESGRFEVAPDRPLVTCLTAGCEIDLGGIGKGFTLDQLALVLASYRIDSALLSAGASTILALGRETWPVELAGSAGSLRIGLKGRALSASGTGVQGAHIVHPDEPDKDPVYLFDRVWVVTREAAMADALSTACFLMDDIEIELFAAEYSHEVDIYVDDPEGSGIEPVRPG